MFTESMKQSAANAGIDVDQLKVNDKGMARVNLGSHDLVMWYEDEENLPVRCALASKGKLPAEKDTKHGASPFKVLTGMKADILSVEPEPEPKKHESKKASKKGTAS